MAIIEPTRKDISADNDTKRYSATLRFWHWANAIVISGSLITVLINSTIIKGEPTSTLIKDVLEKAGAIVSTDQARAAAHALSDHVWNIHVYFGYLLAGLLLFRLLLEFFQVKDQKLILKLKVVYVQFKAIKMKRESRHELAVKSIYILFYLLLIIMVVTGLFLAFEDALIAYKGIRHSVKEVHGFCMYLVLAFIVVHLIGVFLAERKNESAGIVSDMINGGKNS